MFEMKIVPSEYKVLIVDDVQSNILLLKALLGKDGYKIITAINGTEALMQVASEMPDLILLDVMMPVMDGFEVARRLKADAEFIHIPIIFLTALDDTQSVVKGFELGANDFISKPFRKEELMIRIGHQLSLVEARRIILQKTEELKKTIDGRDKLYSVIAHDLRSPMASMKMLLNTLMMSVDKQTMEPDVFDMLEMSNKTSEEVYSLLDNLLKWTKCQLGKLNTLPQPVDLTGLIDGVIEVSVPVAQVKNIALNFIPARKYEVTVDIEMVKCVLRNLISNAIKFSEKDSEVNIYIKEEPGKVIITVEDHGKGIKEEDQGKLLNDATHFTTYGTNSEEGSGLGLLLCRDFVHKNQGELWFVSKEGVGSKFSFSLSQHMDKAEY